MNQAQVTVEIVEENGALLHVHFLYPCVEMDMTPLDGAGAQCADIVLN